MIIKGSQAEAKPRERDVLPFTGGRAFALALWSSAMAPAWIWHSNSKLTHSDGSGRTIVPVTMRSHNADGALKHTVNEEPPLLELEIPASAIGMNGRHLAVPTLTYGLSRNAIIVPANVLLLIAPTCPAEKGVRCKKHRGRRSCTQHCRSILKGCNSACVLLIDLLLCLAAWPSHNTMTVLCVNLGFEETTNSWPRALND